MVLASASPPCSQRPAEHQAEHDVERHGADADDDRCAGVVQRVEGARQDFDGGVPDQAEAVEGQRSTRSARSTRA